MKRKSKKRQLVLGDLIVELFDQTQNMKNKPLERNLLVYAALRHLIPNRIHTNHRITFEG